MLLLIAALITLQTPIETSYNGIWVDGNGDGFVLVSPYTLWGTFDGKHYTAYGISADGKGGFSGRFEDSPDYTFTWNAPLTDQDKSQISLIADYPYDGGPLPPERIPRVPKPEKPEDSGDVAVTYGPTPKILKFVFTNAAKQVVLSDTATFAGSSSKMEIGGTYRSGEVTLSVSEVGQRSRKTLDGVATFGGKSYAIHGTRVWSRGAFTIANRDTGGKVGEGWIEWSPSKRFALAMGKPAPGPTDEVNAYFYLTSDAYPKGLHERLIR